MRAPEPAWPIGRARFDGAGVVQALAPRGMIALLGDCGAPGLREAVRAEIDAAPPERLRWSGGVARAVWMAPGERLLIVPRDRLAPALDAMARAAGEGLAADVSDARAGFGLSGGGARDALAKLTPIDTDEGSLGPRVARRTRLGQVAALVLCEGSRAFEIWVARSVAGYAFELLRGAADPAARVAWHDRPSP